MIRRTEIGGFFTVEVHFTAFETIKLWRWFTVMQGSIRVIPDNIHHGKPRIFNCVQSKPMSDISGDNVHCFAPSKVDV
jgi:hypothetical protein